MAVASAYVDALSPIVRTKSAATEEPAMSTVVNPKTPIRTAARTPLRRLVRSSARLAPIAGGNRQAAIAAAKATDVPRRTERCQADATNAAATSTTSPCLSPASTGCHPAIMTTTSAACLDRHGSDILSMTIHASVPIEPSDTASRRRYSPSSPAIDTNGTAASSSVGGCACSV